MARDADLHPFLKSCEPIAVALSGGTDSSVLLAYARRHTIRASIEADPAYRRRLEGLLGAVKEPGFEDVVIAAEGYREGGADSWKR